MAKNLTAQQKKILNKMGVENANDYLYVKTITTSETGSKSTSKHNSKRIEMVVRHKVTGEELHIDI